MSIKKRLVLLFSVLFAVTLVAVKAQERSGSLYAVSGQVVDSLSSQPVPFATVGVAFAESPGQYVNAVACDGDGKFEIQLRTPGNYLMIIQSVGTTTLTKPFTLTENNRRLELGQLLVEESAQAIGEVTVTAQKPLVRVEIDKLIYSMEDDPEANVNNTLEMLRKVPMVTVDGEDNIQLRGASNFRIYLNGRPSNMLSGRNVSEVLKSMPANTIKNIEVITDPGARYDAEGISGIINIVTTRNLFQGYQGSVAANASTFGAFGGNTHLTAKTGKFGLTGNFNFSRNRNPWGRQESENENHINPQYYREDNTGRSRTTGIFMLGNLEASYEFDTLRLLSLGVNLWNGQFESISERIIEMYNNADGLEYSYKTDGVNNMGYGSTGVNLDYQMRTARKRDEFFTISYRYNSSPDGNESFTYAKDITGAMPMYIRLDQWYDNVAKTTEHTGQIDYINPVSQQHSLEAGLKYILRQNISNVNHYEDIGGNWALLPSVNNDFEHVSSIYAAYAGYSLRMSKFGLRSGIRAEGTRQDVRFQLDENRNFDVDYYNLVPSATISYQLKPTQQIRLGYNLRISRPSIWYLNPYVNDVDRYNISYGNPNLEPEKSNAFNLNYSLFSPKLTLNVSASYSYINNSIQSHTFIDPALPEVKQRTFDNIGRNQRTQLFVNAGWTPNRTFRFNLNAGMNYADMKSEELNVSNSGLTGTCFANVQITLPRDFRIIASGQYMSGFVMLQGNQSGYYFASITANKDFLERKMTVSVSMANPFARYIILNATQTNEFFSSSITQYAPMRQARLSVSYRFGNMTESIRRVQRGITNDDVMGGGSGGGGATGGVEM